MDSMSRSAEPCRKAAYSADLRWRVVWQRLVFEHSFRQIADNLNIAHSIASLMFKRLRRQCCLLLSFPFAAPLARHWRHCSSDS